MASLTESLRSLHRIHRQLSDLRDRLARGPKQVQAMEANVKKADEDLAQAKAAHKQARIASDEKQLQLKQREAKLSDLNAKLMAASSNKEYQLLRDQIAADKQANSVLADEILEALDKIDHLAAAVKTVEQNLGKQKEELARVRQRVQEQQQGLESELARVNAELAQAEESVPEDFKADYLRLSKSRGADSLAPVEGESCGGCFQTLSPQVQDLLRRDKPVFCKSCGRLLYLPE
jgi:predicted  nucleic acid-binding Zn-ribbon protein